MNPHLSSTVEEGWSPVGGPPSWYAVHTRSNFERRVADDLARKGVESFCPSFAEIHQWSDRTKTVARPLFPGYVFTRFTDSGSLRLSIMQSPGAVRIVATGRELAAVSDEEIAAIRKMLSSGKACEPHRYLCEGAVVRVCRGPLKDIEGILVKVKNQARLVLSVTLLSRSVATEVSLSDVEVVSMSGGPGSLVA